MIVLTNMIVVSMVDGNGDLGSHNYFGGQNDHHSSLGGVVEVFNHVIKFSQGTASPVGYGERVEMARRSDISVI